MQSLACFNYEIGVISASLLRERIDVDILLDQIFFYKSVHLFLLRE